MKNIESEILKEKIKILLKIFQEKPNLLAKYLVEYDTFNEEFLQRLDNNKEIKRLLENYESEQEIEKPFFKNLEEMQEYYNSLFQQEEDKKEDQIFPILGFSSREELLVTQLKEAIIDEDYEKAARLRDYIKECGINLEDFF